MLWSQRCPDPSRPIASTYAYNLLSPKYLLHPLDYADNLIYDLRKLPEHNEFQRQNSMSSSLIPHVVIIIEVKCFWWSHSAPDRLINGLASRNSMMIALLDKTFHYKTHTQQHQRKHSREYLEPEELQRGRVIRSHTSATIMSVEITMKIIAQDTLWGL